MVAKEEPWTSGTDAGTEALREHGDGLALQEPQTHSEAAARRLCRTRRCVSRRPASLAASLLLLGASSVVVLHTKRRPLCTEDADGHQVDCRQEIIVTSRLAEDPSEALVGLDERIVELRWFKGKLIHPVGRYFGGHHSSLVARFESGQLVKIEKLGLGNVQYCPSLGSPRGCGMRPGELYKSAGGEFLRLITWRELHAAVAEDLHHYDVVDANCHHAVQQAWNAAVVEGARDHSAVPDDRVVTDWRRFLRYWSGEDPDEGEQGPSSLVDAVFGEEPDRPGRALASAEIWYWPRNVSAVKSYDGVSIRRRRRRIHVGERCRGSKVGEGEIQGNCPHRESCFSDKGDNSYKSDSELSKKCRCNFMGFPHPFSKQRFDKDSRCSKPAGVADSKFTRQLSCGGEQDFSGSLHMRCKCSLSCAKCQSCQDSKGEVGPMDWAQANSNSYGDDACSLSAVEVSHSQDGRSKDNNRNTCKEVLGAEPATGTDFLCQWTCKSGDVKFNHKSVSSFECESRLKEITIKPNGRRADCLKACERDCQEDCASKCEYIMSAALNAGEAECSYVDPKNLGRAPESKRYTDGALAGMFVGVLGGLCILNCALAISKRRANRQKEPDFSSVGFS